MKRHVAKYCTNNSHMYGGISGFEQSGINSEGVNQKSKPISIYNDISNRTSDHKTTCNSNHLPIPSFMRIIAAEDFIEENFKEFSLPEEIHMIEEVSFNQGTDKKENVPSKNTSNAEISSSEIGPTKGSMQVIAVNNMKGLSFY